MIDTTPWNIVWGLIVLGMGIGALEHAMRLGCAPYGKTLRALGDGSFWAIATAAVFFYMYQADDGDLRLYVFIVLIVGAIVYYVFLARVCAVVVWNPVVAVVHGIIWGVGAAVRSVGKRCGRVVRWCRGCIRDMRRSKLPPTMPKE
ncbi:MAG: hypothetical protein KGO83_01115 [Paenibacillaceae bacterium]|nr:hypothetical protein [Paenibacillaceae bacterium]